MKLYPQRTFTIVDVGLLVTCAVFVSWNLLLLAIMALKLNMNDFGKFYYSARFFLDGTDMYQPSPATWIPLSRSITGLFLNLNPPHAHLPILPIALLPPRGALVIWFVASALCVRVTAAFVRQELAIEWPRDFRTRIKIFAAFFACPATAAVVVTGQLAFLIMLPMTLAWRAARHGRWRTAGTILGVLMSIKPFLILFVPYFMIRRRCDAVLSAALGFVACFASGFAAFGIDPYRSWIRTLGSVDWAWAGMNLSLAGLLDRSLSENLLFTPVAVAPTSREVVWIIGSVTIAAITFFVVWRDTSPQSVDRAFAVIVIASLLLSPLGWIYYLWLAVGPTIALFVSPPHNAVRFHGPAATLLWTGGALLFVPTAVTTMFQPSAWATVVLGSASFWALLAIWLAFVVEARHTTRGGSLTTLERTEIACSSSNRMGRMPTNPA